MPDGGQLELAVKPIADLEFVRLEISDSGSGLAPELCERALEPFFTTKPNGTGLGLAIARGVVQGHRGRIRLDPRPGGGTTVSLELPALPPTRESDS